MIKVKLGKAIPYMKGVFGAIQKDFRADVAKDFGRMINDQIGAGISPVAGQGRFVDYSKSYKAQITRSNTISANQKKFGITASAPKFAALGKKLRPVNLTLTGAMLKSQEVKVDQQNGVVVSYSDKKAVWHNTDGAGKSKVIRRMLPDRPAEKFSAVLMTRLRSFAAISAAKILRK